jgi:DNA-directed RNA polymerase subunit RPC12/RpoP
MIHLPAKQRLGDTTIEINKIRTDGGTQPREGIDKNIASEYGLQMQANGVGSFDPVVIFYDGQDYWLADGFHRVQGAKYFNIRSIRADIRQGTRRDAVLYSTGANGKHGLRRTNADKRRAVATMLQDEEWRRWSDRRIAEHCYVSQPFVSNLRAELFPQDSPDNDYQVLRQGADGKTYNVSNIGSKKPPRYPVVGGLYYPVDFEHRVIYNDPRHTAEEIEAPYKPLLANDLLTYDQVRDFHFIDSTIPQSTTYTCSDCGNKVDTVVVDFKTHKQRCASCLEKHETEQKQLEEQRRAAIPPAARLHDMDVLIGRDGLIVGILNRFSAPEPAPEVAPVAATQNPTSIESSARPILPQMPDDDDESEAAQFLALNQHLQSYYDALKLRSRRAARRIMRIGRDYGPGAAREAFAACLDLTKDEESARRALAKARQENEQLRALLKANKISMPKL